MRVWRVRPVTIEEWKINLNSGLRGPLKGNDLNIKGLREALRRIEALKYFYKILFNLAF